MPGFNSTMTTDIFPLSWQRAAWPLVAVCAMSLASCGDEYANDRSVSSAYVLDVSSPSPTSFDKTESGNYTVKSYRQSADKKQEFPVAWAVTGYDANDDNVFSMDEKPDWLISLSKTRGEGGLEVEKGNAKLAPTRLVDHLTPRNEALRQAAERGSAAERYDLSTHKPDGSPASRNTANCYLVSAPGYYKLPLVYGNSIADDKTNERAYVTKNTGKGILVHFVDHEGKPIETPYINAQNAAQPAVAVKVIWADEPSLVTNASIQGQGLDSYLCFDVARERIKNGNVVVAAVNNKGVCLWSWHLWFAPTDALDVVTCLNQDNVPYKFSKETLGWKYTEWKDPVDDHARTVRVRIEQVTDSPDRQTDVFTITQKSGSKRDGYSTFYQFGRKDAFPGIDKDLAVRGKYRKNAGDVISIPKSIQNPAYFYIDGESWGKDFGWLNLWSMDNTGTDINDNPVVKTVYDPCPPGFHLPSAGAFTGFNFTGLFTGREEINASGSWKRGWQFNGRANGHATTVYFPASGCRKHNDGWRKDIGRRGYDRETKDVYNEQWVGYYWTAMPSSPTIGRAMYHTPNAVAPIFAHYRASGFSIHPVAE